MTAKLHHCTPRRAVHVCASAIAAVLLLGSAAGVADPASSAGQQESQRSPGTAPDAGKKNIWERMVSAVRQHMPEGVYRASRLTGWNVNNTRGQTVGEIDDLLLDPAQAQVKYAALAYGDPLGLRKKYFAVPLSALRGNETRNEIVVDVSPQTLAHSQGFDGDSWPASAGSWPPGDGSAPTPTPAGGELVRASKYLDREVDSADGKALGKLKDLAIDLDSGRIRYAVIARGGGPLGFGETYLGTPVQTLKPGRQADTLVLDASAAAVDAAPTFGDDNWPLAVDSMDDLVYPPQGGEADRAR